MVPKKINNLLASKSFFLKLYLQYFEKKLKKSEIKNFIIRNFVLKLYNKKQKNKPT